ncbi:MAG TPA: hypothetical protein VN861_03085 [Candidatus Acidoferrales bacterium]|nr:hypothetical protein [Candidatus Acidoferrales bacterium]
MAKMKNWHCNCDDEFDTKEQLASHYRKEHPEDGYGCWDQAGTLGDKFSDNAMNAVLERFMDERNAMTKTRTELKAYKDKHASMVTNYNELSRRLQIVQLAVAFTEPHKAE